MLSFLTTLFAAINSPKKRTQGPVIRLTALCLSLLAAGPAAALPDLPDGDDRPPSAAGLAVSFAFIGAIDLAFVGVDIGLLATGGVLPPGWAIVQMIIGGGNALYGLIATPLGALIMAGSPKDSDGPLLLGSGIILLLVGGWLIGNAICNLVKYFGHRDRSSAFLDSPLMPSIAASPSAHGAQAVFSWRF